MATRPASDPSGGSLLVVIAHPDDESVACGGLIARCSDVGVRVAILCLTHGEHGPGGEEERLRDVRARELSAAAGVLGVHDVVLLDHEDGMLPWIDADLLEADIVAAIRRFEPDVLVTFDRDGLYWHPDHVAVHERVTAAIAGLGPSAPALYYVSMPRGTMRSVAEAAARDGACGGASSPTVLGIEDVDAFGWGAPDPTLVVEAGPCAARKVTAIRCHRTQIEGSAIDCLDEDVVARLLAAEHYRRAETGRRGDTVLDRLGTPVAASKAS